MKSNEENCVYWFYFDFPNGKSLSVLQDLLTFNWSLRENPKRRERDRQQSFHWCDGEPLMWLKIEAN